MSHGRWDGKYHVVIIPSYLKRKLYGRFRKRVGKVIREWCRQRGIEVLEGYLMPDHVHMRLGIPPK
ncbi:MAG: transposase [Deltaproteobacteria bacterium]|nr:MAG: transposase [Deltaproteobacteria bacterium]